MFTLMRQLDWLSLLNFEVLHYSRFHVLPRKRGAAFKYAPAGAGAVYSLLWPTKRTIPLAAIAAT